MNGNHYIQQTKHDPNKFDVMNGPNRVFYGLDSVDFAEAAAEKLNKAYKAGYQDAEDALRSKVMNLLFNNL